MYGLGDDSSAIINTNLTQLFNELHASALSIAQLKAAGDTADLATMQAHFNAVKQQYLTLAAKADAPTYWQGLLGRVGDVQNAISGVTDAAITGLTATGYLLPVGLFLLAFVVLRSNGIIGKGKGAHSWR